MFFSELIIIRICLGYSETKREEKIMAFGDCLIDKLKKGVFLNCDGKKTSKNAFWIVLRDCAAEDILACAPNEVDSHIAVSAYYAIMIKYIDYLPDFICEIIPSNGQERFRIVNRNIFTSNAFNPDGLANHPGITAYKIMNESRRGSKIVFKAEEKDNEN